MKKYLDGNRKAFHLVYYHVALFVFEILAILFVVFGIMKCCQLSYQFCYEVFGPVSFKEKPGEDKEFRVVESDTAYSVAERLEAEGLIGNKYSFYLRAVLMYQEPLSFHSGGYVLNTSMNYEEMIDELTASSAEH